MNWLVFVAIIGLVMAILGAWVALINRRGVLEGFILGMLFGPFGVLIEALLPLFYADAELRPSREQKLLDQSAPN